MQLSYDFSNFEIGNDYQGQKHQGAFVFKDQRIDSKTTLSLLKTDGYGDKTNFLRPRHETSYLLDRSTGLKIGVFYDGEVNERRSSSGSNDLLSSSFSYDLTKIYFRNSEDTRVHYSIDYTFRNDKFPSGDQLVKSIDARELTGGLGFQVNAKNKIGMNFGWRNFEVLEEELLPQPNTTRRTFLGKYNH
jgi:hypothetical protein